VPVALVIIAVLAVTLRVRKWQDRYSIIASVFNSLYVPGTMMPLRAAFKPMIPIAAIAGACYGLSGMMIAAKTRNFGADLPGFMSSMMLTVLTGAFAGKVSIFGGKDSLLAAAGGVLLVTAVFYGLDFVLVPQGAQICLKYVIIGAAICQDIRDHYLPAHVRNPKPRSGD
jgi:ABC-type glucose/galactose transport system permease subunit